MGTDNHSVREHEPSFDGNMIAEATYTVLAADRRYRYCLNDGF